MAKNRIARMPIRELDAKLRKTAAAKRAAKAQGVKVVDVKKVTKLNLMTGLPYEEAENTPLCCSPASETYWSM